MNATTAIPVIIACIAGLIAIYEFIKKIIIPKFRKSKLKKLYQMLKEWFDEIDIHLNNGLNLDLLNNKENKIRSFINDSHLNHYKIQLSEKFRYEFLKFCGIKKELRNDKELFFKYARCPADGIFIDIFCNLQFNSFYVFYSNYKRNDKATNFTDVEMRMKFLKMYLDVKED